MVEFVILFLFFLAAVCAVVLAVLETPAAKWDEVDKKQRRLFKVTRGMRRGFQRNVVFVDPHYSHGMNAAVSTLSGSCCCLARERPWSR